jgi:hypothetical protein
LPGSPDNSRLGKRTSPEKSGLGTSTPNGFRIFQAGEVEFLGKLQHGNRYTKRVFKNPWKTPGWQRVLFSPQK